MGSWDVSAWPSQGQINFFESHKGVFLAADVRDKLFWPHTSQRVALADHQTPIASSSTLEAVALELANLRKKVRTPTRR